MTKVIFGLFAHPDDESFGVAATLLAEASAGSVIHLVTLTSGEHGTNPDHHPDLGKLRLEEWRTAGTLLGASSMTHFGYKDGVLSNSSLLEISERFEQHVRQILDSATNEDEVEFMSFDTNGISGHIDHIVASRACCLVFYRLKPYEPRLKQLRLRCLSVEDWPDDNIEWLYMEKGRTLQEIDQVIDERGRVSEVMAVMQTHHSQYHDYQNHIDRLGDKVAINYFVVKR